MANKTVEQLEQVKSEDVKPMYNADEVADKLASALHYMRQGGDAKQRLILELMYSVLMAVRK